jgi:hypothetical protein
MSFGKPYGVYKQGDLIYGLVVPREWFSKHVHATKPMFMQDYGGEEIDVDSDFATSLKADHKKFGEIVTMVENFDFFDTKQVKQKCKGGLWWATQVAKKQVHFYLEGLNFWDTCNNTRGLRSITDAELRWIYRFKDNGNVQEYIQFWRPAGCKKWADLQAAKGSHSGVEQCGPPWEDFEGGMQVWASYKPKCNTHINGVPK